MNPFFTVIITTYNRPQKISRAIQSVLDQSFNDFELIIVNDGSLTDYSSVVSYISDFKSKVHYFYKENEERSIARNFGIDKSTGSFICFLDDDDYYLENHLEVLYKEISKCNFSEALYHTYSYKINNKQEKVKMPIVPIRKGYNIFEYYVTDGIMTMNNTCGHVSAFKEFPFDSKMIFAEDSFQRLLAMTKFNVHSVPVYTTVYDMSSETSTTQHNIKIPLSYITSWKIIFNHNLLHNRIRKSIKKEILFEKYCLLIHYHRNELPIKQFFKYILEALFCARNFSDLLTLTNNIRWRLQRR